MNTKELRSKHTQSLVTSCKFLFFKEFIAMWEAIFRYFLNETFVFYTRTVTIHQNKCIIMEQRHCHSVQLSYSIFVTPSKKDCNAKVWLRTVKEVGPNVKFSGE